MVARRAHNPKVTSSNLVSATNLKLKVSHCEAFLNTGKPRTEEEKKADRL